MIVVIDGTHLVHRSFHTFRQLSNSEGYHTGTIYGFFSIMLSYREKIGNKFIITWEGGNCWRKQIYAGYKKKREEKRTVTQEDYNELTNAMRDIKILCSLIGLIQIEKEGYEADDVIAAIVKKLKSDIKILSGDKDLLQLINDKNNISVLRPHPKLGLMEYKEETVKENFNVSVADMPLYLSILGDHSDNIDGIKGYGKVKSSRFINSESEPLKVIEKMFPAEYERIKRNLIMITLNHPEHEIKEFLPEDLYEFQEDLVELNRKLFKYQIQAFNSKSLYDAFNNRFFIGEMLKKLFNLTLEEARI